MTRLPEHYILDLSYARDYLLCACGLELRAKDGIEWAEHRNRYVLTTKAERKRGKPFTVVGRR